MLRLTLASLVLDHEQDAPEHAAFIEEQDYIRRYLEGEEEEEEDDAASDTYYQQLKAEAEDCMISI